MVTRNITGNHLHDQSLNNGPGGPSQETINVFGTAEMNLTMATNDTDTVNLAAHSEWIGGFTAGFNDTLNINGKGVFDNTGSRITDASVHIRVPVVGSGNFTLDSVNSRLEFTSSVSANQGVAIISASNARLLGPSGINPAVVQVDNPAAFHGGIFL